MFLICCALKSRQLRAAIAAGVIAGIRPFTPRQRLSILYPFQPAIRSGGVFLKLTDRGILFSPSDLITFMESPFASAMNRQRLLNPRLVEQMDKEDPLLVHLSKKGFAHENAFAASLEAQGEDVCAILDADSRIMRAQTLEAMRAGRNFITQAYLTMDRFAGQADFLVKVPGASRLGDFHYEVWAGAAAGRGGGGAGQQVKTTARPVRLLCLLHRAQTVLP